MYAIIESGGKQHKVVEGEVLRLEKLDAEAGATVNFSNVLLLAMDDKVTIGAPYVENAQVVAEVVEQGRGEKIHIVKFHRRKHHQKTTGHRQYYTEVKITGIGLGATAKPKAAKAKTEEVPAEEKPAAKAAAKKPAAKKPAAKKATSKTATAKKAVKAKTEE
jgi:large subunit ribosomal protein L21